ncbi:Gtr1/RagA G protein conserved region-domain-containing protein [Melampsora americana]|nr:Gtr1/RagA G protein conserved region-domain-containing protein [Melampsora americana]
MEGSVSSLLTFPPDRPKGAFEPVRPDRPKLLFMGPRSGGKSSIREVVFHKLQPDQTLHLETTRRITQDDINSFIDFEIWDLPGPLESDEFAMPFAQVGAVIFVIDAQSSYLTIIPQLAMTLIKAYEINPSLHFEIFMHKIDAVTQDYRNGNVSPTNLPTVFDYSIYDALSRVIMKIIPQQAALEQLMNVLAQQSGVENCILFDTWTKLYIATDSSPTEKPLLEMCSEFMDIFTDLSELYGVPHQVSPVTRPVIMASGSGGRRAVTQPPGSRSPRKHRSTSRGHGRDSSPRTRSRTSITTPVLDHTPTRGRRMITSHVKLDTSFSGHRELGNQEIVDQPGRVVSYYEINQYLTLVCIAHEDVMRTQGSLIEYNVSRVRDSITKIFAITNASALRRASLAVSN